MACAPLAVCGARQQEWGKLALQRDAAQWGAQATEQNRRSAALSLIGTNCACANHRAVITPAAGRAGRLSRQGAGHGPQGRTHRRSALSRRAPSSIWNIPRQHSPLAGTAQPVRQRAEHCVRVRRRRRRALPHALQLRQPVFQLLATNVAGAGPSHPAIIRPFSKIANTFQGQLEALSIAPRRDHIGAAQQVCGRSCRQISFPHLVIFAIAPRWLKQQHYFR